MRNSKTTKEFYEQLLQMRDLHSFPELDGEIMIWKLYKNAYIRAYCDSYDTCIDIINDSNSVRSLIHWHPDEENMLEELHSLGKKGNILVIKKFLFGMGVFYVGEPEKFQFHSEKKHHRDKLIYLEQK